MRKHTFFAALALLGTFYSASFGAIFFVDLGGVCLDRSSLKACYAIGPTQFFGFYNPFNLDNQLFAFLHAIAPRQPETPMAYYQGAIMPQLMCEFMVGDKTSMEIRTAIAQAIKKHKKIFSTKHERQLVQTIADFIFNPKSLAQVMTLNHKTINILKHLHKKTDAAGNRMHAIYILSNWDAESFPFVQEKFPRLFKYVDGIIISGVAHCMKPDSAIFSYAFEQFDVNPDSQLTIFIDDQEENINAAQQLQKKQLKPILFKNSSSLKKTLKEWSIW
ncbi:MAG: hypothetical protein WCE21_03400 [Candidatus Babeliales bacterium]